MFLTSQFRYPVGRRGRDRDPCGQEPAGPAEHRAVRPHDGRVRQCEALGVDDRPPRDRVHAPPQGLRGGQEADAGRGRIKER